MSRESIESREKRGGREEGEVSEEVALSKREPTNEAMVGISCESKVACKFSKKSPRVL